MSAIFYGSSTGNTESAAKAIAEHLGIQEVFDIAKEGVAKIEKYDKIILGTSTWGSGDLQDDWDDEWEAFKKINFKGKTAALFGLGDQECYSDNYLDAMGAIYEVVVKNGGIVVGEWSSEGYIHDASSAEIEEGYFVGLALDEDNESELSASRIEQWCSQIKEKII
ncbi:MAG: flavodoxin [Campylobacterales bacterium]|nr:flavodoxin [Campylobacterales bacterium]